jgi:rhamnosyltransferase
MTSSEELSYTTGASRAVAVVVTHHPSLEVLGNVSSLLKQFSRVVIVDNTPGAESHEALRSFEQDARCMVVHNGVNLGLGAALNVGIQTAIKEGAEWIATFDQDSRIRENFLGGMLEKFSEINLNVPLGMVSPVCEDQALGIILPPLRASSGEILGCMTSGAMLHADVYKTVGPMEEDLFIDYVDLEYCLRLRSRGFKIVESRDAVLLHSLGRLTVRTVLGKQLHITNHSPKRRYYIHRNRLVLVKRYFWADPEWSRLKLKTLILDTFQVLIFEDQKLAKAGYMARALFDGLFNRLGQRVPL